jgi:aryl-alcohol dehydrogenase-like predicted oxidoreductase
MLALPGAGTLPKTISFQLLKTSLKRLNTDYIDLYQLHGGTIEDPIDETIEAFELLKEQGKIRAYGISSIRPNVIREYLKRSNIVSIMMQYSLLDRRPEETCLELIGRHNVSVITRGTLAKGLLSGKPAKPYLDHSAGEVNQAARATEIIAKKEKESSSRTACRFVLQADSVASAVIGFRTSEQIADTICGQELLKLSNNDYELLSQSVTAKKYLNHR